jgi:hypothetical protein
MGRGGAAREVDSAVGKQGQGRRRGCVVSGEGEVV